MHVEALIMTYVLQHSIAWCHALTHTLRWSLRFTPPHTLTCTSVWVSWMFLFCYRERKNEREREEKRPLISLREVIKLNVERSRRSVAALSEFCQRRAQRVKEEIKITLSKLSRSSASSEIPELASHLEGRKKSSKKFFRLFSDIKVADFHNLRSLSIAIL